MLTHKGTQPIETARLLLRRVLPTDAEPMFRNWASDPAVTKFLTWPTHDSVDTTASLLNLWIREYERPDTYHWMIVLKEPGEPIGTISVVRQEPSAREAEIGYCIGARWWHQGITSEALAAVMRFLFVEVGMDLLCAKHDVRNPNSGAVMRKCGMRYEGTVCGRDQNNQGVCDTARYGIRRAEWADAMQVQSLYRTFDEDSRLTRTQAARVEFLTTTAYIEKYLTPGAKILDVGAGVGEYSLYFARKGYQVSALELADANIEAFRAKLTENDPIALVQGNALDLSRYEANYFDAVLLFGPLYHLHEEQDRLRCIEEAKRVCKEDGKIFFAFISNDLVILTMQQCEQDYLLNGDYDKETFRLTDEPFVFHTVDRCRALLQKAGIRICHEIASDGASELLQDLINGLSREAYEQYLRYHFYICEKPEFLGMSNHLLFIGEPI